MNDNNNDDATKVFDEVEDVYYKCYYDLDFEDSSSDDEGSSNKSGDVQCMKSVESSDVSVESNSNSVVYVTTKKSSVIKESEKAVWESSEYSNHSDSSLSAKSPSPSPSSSSVSSVDTELFTRLRRGVGNGHKGFVEPNVRYPPFGRLFRG